MSLTAVVIPQALDVMSAIGVGAAQDETLIVTYTLTGAVFGAGLHERAPLTLTGVGDRSSDQISDGEGERVADDGRHGE